MAEASENVSFNSSGVEVFVDPDNEVFFGPVTQKEMELRKPLPRKTLHPCEILEISKRGYTFHEWEEYKEQMQRNEQNKEAINDVFGNDTDESSSSSEDGDNCDQSLKEQEQQQQKSLQNVYSPDATTDSFNSCESKEQNQLQDVSGVASLNDTWEIQERMLALAEKLERGEAIPELGICRHASGAVEYRSQPAQHLEPKEESEDSAIANVSPDSQKPAEINSSSSDADDYEEEAEDKENVRYIIDGEPFEENNAHEGVPEILVFRPRESDESTRGKISQEPAADKQIQQLVDTMDSLAVRKVITETLVRDAPTIFRLPTPMKKMESSGSTRNFLETPTNTPRSNVLKKKPLSTPRQQPISMVKPDSRPNSAVKASKPCFSAAASPVGLYIRSLPEPMFIENVRPIMKKKEVQSNPSAIKPPRVAMKNKDGRWSLAPSSMTPSKDTDAHVDRSAIQPVLPMVLHEAAASLITDKKGGSSGGVHTPGTGGKIGKLLERAVTPTVLKHQGRMRVPTDTAKTSQIINSPSKSRSGLRSDSSSMMEVSVLEKVTTSKSSIPVYKQFLQRK